MSRVLRKTTSSEAPSPDQVDAPVAADDTATITPNEDPNPMTHNVHLTLQGKGGVGKSKVSWWLAQYLSRDGRTPPAMIDTDPVNSTFSGYAGLGAQRLELLADDNNIDTRRFDTLMEQLLTANSDFVIDNGAATFVPLTSYLIENDAISMIGNAGRQVVVHVVIAGSSMLLDTLAGFKSLAEQLPDDAKIIVWLNEFQGPIQHDGKDFENMQVYERFKDRISGIVRLTKQSEQTFGKDISDVLEQKLTIDEALASDRFTIMSKQRLSMVRRAVFEQLDVALP
jgi:hypothetical protein